MSDGRRSESERDSSSGLQNSAIMIHGHRKYAVIIKASGARWKSMHAVKTIDDRRRKK